MTFLASCDDDEQMTHELSQREKIISFFEAINTRNVATIEELVTEDYIQHNPFIPTGRDLSLDF